MDLDTFRSTQVPYKELYARDADAALLTLKARGTADTAAVTCKVETGRGLAGAGIPRKAGGPGPGPLPAALRREACTPVPGFSSAAAPAGVGIRSGSVSGPAAAGG